MSRHTESDCGCLILQQVEFDDAPQLAKADQARRFDWWKHTKQLQHGSLLFLWWDGEPGGLPNMMFATVCDRKEQELAPRGEPRRRPQLVGIRWVAGFMAQVAACCGCHLVALSVVTCG